MGPRPPVPLHATAGDLLAMAELKFKIDFLGELRRFSFIANELSCNGILLAAAARFGLPSTEGVSLSYIDEDGDRVTLSSDAELQEVVRQDQPGPSSGTIRLSMSRNAPPSSPVEEAKAESASGSEPSASPKQDGGARQALLSDIRRGALLRDIRKRSKDLQDEKKALKERKRELKQDLKELKHDLKEQKKAEKAAGSQDSESDLSTHELQENPDDHVAECADALSFEGNAAPGQEGAGSPVAAPTGEHMLNLVDAIIESLELDRETVYAQINTTSPDQIRESLGADSTPGGIFRMFRSFRDNFDGPPDSVPPPPPPPPGHGCGGPPPPPPPPPFSNPCGDRWRNGGPWKHWRHGGPCRQGGSAPGPGGAFNPFVQLFGGLMGQAPRHAGRCGPAGQRDPAGPGRCPFGGPGRGASGAPGRGKGPCGPRGCGRRWRREQDAAEDKSHTSVPPSECLWPGNQGDKVKSLQKTLLELGFLQLERPRHFWSQEHGTMGDETMRALKRFQEQYGIEQHGMYDNDTKDSLLSLIDTLNTSATSSEPEVDVPTATPVAPDAARVELVDTDGDLMLFTLSEDGTGLQEYVNGKLEIPSISWLVIEADSGKVRDEAGHFNIKPSSETTAKLQRLTQLANDANVFVFAKDFTIPPTSREGVAVIDIDLGAGAQAGFRANTEASIRNACAQIGEDPKVAFRALSGLFSELREAASDFKDELKSAAGDLKDEFESAAKEMEKSLGEEFVDVKQDLEEESQSPIQLKSAPSECSHPDTATGTGAQAASTPARPYQDAIASIMSMGLCTPEQEDFVVELLKASNGNVNAVVDQLLLAPDIDRV